MSTITQKMIASEAKVSQALVSLILAENSSPGEAFSKRRLRVSEETRKRVLETAARLGYQARVHLRSAEFKKDQSLALLRLAAAAADGDFSPEARRTGEMWQQTLQNALIEAASQMGFALTIRVFQHAREAEQWLESSQMDGLLFGSPFQNIPGKLHGVTPMISLCGKALPSCDTVSVDGEEIAAVALEHLQASGHRRVALVGSHLLPWIASIRPAVFKECASALDIEAVEEFEDCGNAKDFFEKFLAPENAPNKPTAVLAEESLAIQIRQEALRRGVVLPRDLSLIGLGGSAFPDLDAPALTVVNLSPEDLARAALRLMADRLQKAPEAFWKVGVSPKLAIRESVAEIPTVRSRRSRIPK